MATKIIFLQIFCYLLLAGDYTVVSGFTPDIYNAQVTSECDQSDPLQDEQLTEALSKVLQEQGPPGPCNPPRNRSCQEILDCFPSAPSGNYQITVSNGSLVQSHTVNVRRSRTVDGQGGSTEGEHYINHTVQYNEDSIFWIRSNLSDHPD